MHQVTGEYPDYSRASNKNHFYLDADKGFIYFKWSPPIRWKGRVGGVDVTFTQVSHSGAHQSDYDWSNYPSEVSGAIPYIVEAIDDAMRIMD